MAAGGNGDPLTITCGVPRLAPINRGNMQTMNSYDVSQSMVLWQIDSWDKLAPYGFRVNACIDAKAGIMVWAKIANNLRQDTLFGAYKAAADLWGRPLKVRSNCTGSDKLVEEDMVGYRGHAVPSTFSRGPSLRGTQRIEVWWLHMEKYWANHWNLQCQYLVEEKWLNVGDPWHMTSLHITFFAQMKQSLTECVRRWNNEIVWKNTGANRPPPRPHLPVIPGEREPCARPPRHAAAPDGQGAWILVTDTEAMAVYRDTRKPVELFPDCPRIDSVRLPALRPDRPLPQDIAQVRDWVYSATSSSLVVANKYRLHLSLSAVCFKAWESGMPLRQWLHTEAATNTHPSLRAASLLISSKLAEKGLRFF